MLDIACGTGTTSVFLAQEFGCHVTGVDYGAQQIERATAAAMSAGVADRTAFEVGDAESLLFDDGSFTAVICECAFCTFPSKAQAASEMYRVLAPGGRVGITDLTVNGPLPEALQGVAAWVACVADAQPVQRYAAILTAAGFARIATEEHNDAIAKLIADIQTKLMGVSILAGLGKIDLGRHRPRRRPRDGASRPPGHPRRPPRLLPPHRHATGGVMIVQRGRPTASTAVALTRHREGVRVRGGRPGPFLPGCSRTLERTL